MVKIIVIFTIVFVYYCEINAEIHYLRNKKTGTADFQNPLETEKDHVDIKRLRRRTGTQTYRYTTGSREDNNGLTEFVQSDSEAHINIFFKPGVITSRRFNKPGKINNRRFNKVYTVDENTETDEFDRESIKPKTRKKHHHHSRKNTKKHDLANNEEKETHKKNEKDMKENDSGSGSTKSIMKIHKPKRRFKIIKDRDDKKKSKHRKDTSMSHERKKDKKKQVKQKSKDKKEEKRIDKTKGKIERLSKAIITYSSENDKTYKKKQLKDKTRHKPNEPSKNNKSKDALRLTKSSSAQPKTSIKVTKPTQRKISKKKPTTTKSTKPTQKVISKKNPTTTKSTKPNPKPTHQMPQEIRKVQLHPLLRVYKPHLEADKHLRSTKFSALSLDNKKKKGHPRSDKKLRQEDEKIEKENPNDDLPLSKLSPYSITTQMQLLMKEFPEANVSITKLGRTVEYNDIIMVTIREGLSENATAYFRTRESKYIDDVPEKKIIFIVHGLTVMGLNLMTSLVEVAQLKLLMSYYLKHLDKFDFILMPLANPDGYSALFSSVLGIWNKNKSPQDVCSGVFLDRNFDVSWNDLHNISSCSYLYPGATPFSEEESKAVRDVFHQYSHKILAYIHVHAGTFNDQVFKGEAVLYPKGYSLTQSDDDKYIDIKGEIDEAMKNASFRVMTVTVDTLANWYGIVQGTSVDYAASVYGIPYALEFVMQIYDTPSTINAALTEIWSRVIDTTFNNMWKNLQRGGDARRKHYRLRY